MGKHWRSPRPLFFVTMENGCQVCLSHALDNHGYLSKCWSVDSKNVWGRLFRLLYEAHHGKQPTNTHIHHTCENRACCNVQHLVALTKEEHMSVSKQHYWDKIKRAA